MGLALAMASAVLIYLFITDELGMTVIIQKRTERIVLPANFFNRDGVSNLKLSSVAPPVGPLIKNDFGEVELIGTHITIRPGDGYRRKWSAAQKLRPRRTCTLAEPDFSRFWPSMYSREILKNRWSGLLLLCFSENAAKNILDLPRLLANN